MLRVGLTGNIGSGKSTVARIFGFLGVPVFIADIRARFITDQPSITKSIADAFGEEVISRSGEIDRKKLGSVVFSDPSKLALLNSIIHPAVRKEFDAWCTLFDDRPFVIQEAAVLFESGQALNFDRIIVVTAPEALRIERVILRDNMDREEVIKRIGAQWPEEEKKAKADFIVVNDGSRMVIPQVIDIWEKLNL